MTSEKLHHQLEQITSKIEGLKYTFIDSQSQEEWESCKNQIIEILETMGESLDLDSEIEPLESTEENE